MPSATREAVAALVARARKAQAAYERCSQEQLDAAALAVGWAIMKPQNNRALAEAAVRDTGLGNVADKVAKNHRKTLGLLRDLRGVRTVGVIAEYPEKGVTEIARAVGVVAAITPSTNPGATPANQIINALKCGNAVILAPSPKGYSTCALLLKFIHEEFGKIHADPDLVQVLAAPVTKEATHELMRQCDLIAATGSQSNIRAAYSSGKPAIGVGQGNVVSIVDASADLADAAAKVARSKTFDNATSCSSENSVIILAPVYEAMVHELGKQGGVLLDADEKA
jgi:sulfoacetaldehyde dehydrogenase